MYVFCLNCETIWDAEEFGEKCPGCGHDKAGIIEDVKPNYAEAWNEH